MYTTTNYNSPLGKMLLAADEIGITGIWFEGCKYFAKGLSQNYTIGENASLIEAKKWLDVYFAGGKPDFTPALHLTGSDFQQKVLNLLRDTPYGQTTTYGNIAKKIILQLNIKNMSAQAIGAAVGHNPIAIIIPCHRVIGANNRLIGYAGGIDKKLALLKNEGVDISDFDVKKNSF